MHLHVYKMDVDPSRCYLALCGKMAQQRVLGKMQSFCSPSSRPRRLPLDTWENLVHNIYYVLSSMLSMHFLSDAWHGRLKGVVVSGL